jgi:hypothetical protein
MRSTVGVLFVAAGVVVGVHGLTRWPADSPPAVAETAAVVVTMPTLHTHRASNATEAASPASPLALPAADDTVAARDLGRPRPPRDTTLAATPYNLPRELQQALRRAHCYGGPINGVWTAGTRRAMQAFLARANATLPVDKPDVVLLALLQNAQDARCGSCPSGQRFGAGDACLPVAMLNEAGLPRRAPPSAPTAALFGSAHEPAGTVAAPSERAVLDPPVPPIAGRMSIGGPRLATSELPQARGFAPTEAQGATLPREGRLLRHRVRRFAVAHRHGRTMRFAYRPARGGGMVGWLFGGFRF